MDARDPAYSRIALDASREIIADAQRVIAEAQALVVASRELRAKRARVANRDESGTVQQAT